VSAKENWDRLADFDAMWTVLTAAEKKGRKWDAGEFFATGRQAVDELMQRLAALGIEVSRGQAMDFGCGLGRLSQGLSRHFRHVAAVDISSSMIAQAERHNSGRLPILFLLGNETGLPVADASVDFLLSLITLQHIPQRLQAVYLTEFLRVLRPGGVAVFQTPSRHVNGSEERFFLDVNTGMGESRIDLHYFPKAGVEELMRANAATLLHAAPDRSAGAEFESYLYFVRKG
jgi:SAM-dependent methyltransferase